MKAIIIEDEEFAARRLQQLIGQIAPELEVAALLHSVEAGKKWFGQNEPPDLVFLDIQLNDGYGFDLLDDLGLEMPVIFTTAYSEYAIRGFKYNGIDYLLKPIAKEDLQKALQKWSRNLTLPSDEAPLDLEQLRQLFKREYKHRFMVKVGNQFKWFNVEEIAYFKSEQGLIYLHTHKKQAFPIDYSIDQLESILNPVQFFRINRKFMVSVKSVVEVHSYFNSRLLVKLVPKDEEPVIVSRERTSNFKDWLDL